jgi:hypothetical protein
MPRPLPDRIWVVPETRVAPAVMLYDEGAARELASNEGFAFDEPVEYVRADSWRPPVKDS